MTELQNNPDPGTYAIERFGREEGDPHGKHKWKVTKRNDDGGEGTELGVFENYTEAVAAVNEDRGVDTEDLKAEAAGLDEFDDEDEDEDY